MSNLLGFLELASVHEDGMKIPIPLIELHLDLLPSSQEVGELLQSDRCDSGVSALGSPFEVHGLDHFVFVVLGPHFVQITMKVEALRVWDTEFFRTIVLETFSPRWCRNNPLRNMPLEQSSSQ